MVEKTREMDANINMDEQPTFADNSPISPDTVSENLQTNQPEPISKSTMASKGECDKEKEKERYKAKYFRKLAESKNLRRCVKRLESRNLSLKKVVYTFCLLLENYFLQHVFILRLKRCN
jgi:hypothetical protein